MAQKQEQEPVIPPILRLSPEILPFIFEYFCSHCCDEYQWPFSQTAQDSTTLFNLCLVSRYFRGTAQEILYHDFDLQYLIWQPNDHSKRRLEPFLTTVASRPDLARSVNAVFIRVPLVKNLDFEEVRRAFDICAHSLGASPRDIYQYLEECNSRRLGSAPPGAMKRAFFLGEPVPDDMKQKDYIPIIASQLLTMLVSLLPNLVHLGIAKGHTPSYEWEVDVSPDTFHVLGIESIRLKTLESDETLDYLTSWTPGLETLVTSGVGGFFDMPGVRNLHIRSKAALRKWRFNKCLRACTGPLSTFSYTSIDSDILSVVECLDQSRFHASLESLHLIQRRDPMYRTVESMPSLKLFTRLKTLSIPTTNIYGPNLASPHHISLVDILPPNITSLTLVRHDESTPLDLTMEDLRRLINAKPTLFPQLREIRMSMEHIFDESLTALFEPIGVDLIHQELLGSSWNCSGEFLRVVSNSPWNEPR